MKNVIALPSQEVLRSMLQYDSATGVLKWRHYRKNIRPDLVVGCSKGKVGGTIHINKVTYRATRIIWMLVYGVDPKGMVIDYINGNVSDARLSNLRICTRDQNSKSKRSSRSEASNVPGVTYNKNSKLWNVMLQPTGQSLWIGQFITEEDAIAAAQFARIKHYGDSAGPSVDDLSIALQSRVKRKKSSQYVGVSFHKNTNKWVAYHNKQYIGIYNTEELANIAVLAHINAGRF